jgi:hypothetical protein
MSNPTTIILRTNNSLIKKLISIHTVLITTNIAQTHKNRNSSPSQKKKIVATSLCSGYPLLPSKRKDPGSSYRKKLLRSPTIVAGFPNDDYVLS